MLTVRLWKKNRKSLGKAGKNIKQGKKTYHAVISTHNIKLNISHISLNLQKLSFVPKFKYLGSFITQDNSDDENMRRQRGNCYARSNGITKNF